MEVLSQIYPQNLTPLLYKYCLYENFHFYLHNVCGNIFWTRTQRVYVWIGHEIYIFIIEQALAHLYVGDGGALRIKDALSRHTTYLTITDI